MMAIHAVLIVGHLDGELVRRQFFTEFKYVIGGCTYSLSDIQNGILRENQPPPYNFVKLFGAENKPSKVSIGFSYYMQFQYLIFLLFQTQTRCNLVQAILK